jgi:hypothetical protein
MSTDSSRLAPPRLALDIGSTVVKLAWLDPAGDLLRQQFFARDFAAGIGEQIRRLLAELNIDPEKQPLLACSSANGGLRVGIVCLSMHFSGATMRNQVLLAGANPVFVHEFDETASDSRRVDILLVGGGIDCADAGPAGERILRFDPGRYRYDTLIYAGNRHLAAAFVARLPNAVVIANPQGETLSNRVGSVFETVRRAYLDDLVFKEGISELPAALAHRIRPTPEVTSRGFLRSVSGHSSFTIVGTCLALDIGGATTDLHYTVELISEDSPVRPASGVSVARYVFADLGIVASRDTLLMQLRAHPHLYEFLSAVGDANVQDTYVGLRDGEIDPPAELLSYACLYLALDRFASGKGPGLPVAKLDTLAQLILTGGAAQAMAEAVVARVVTLLVSPGSPPPLVQVDRRYEIWVAGITWTEEASS